MQWTVRLETKTGRGEVRTTELVTVSRPVRGATLADIGLGLSEAKVLLAGLQASPVREQLAEYAACHRVCAHCQALLSLKDRRTRRLQTLFGTIAVEAPRFRRCHCA
jgi:hypothetical protein